MAKLIGMGGSVTIGSTPYAVSEWSINVTGDIQDVTDTGSAGWVSRIGGVKSAELSFRAFWGGSVATLSTVFAINTKVSASLFIGGGSQDFAGDFYISSFTVTNNCKTPVEFQCTAQSDGVVTPPT